MDGCQHVQTNVMKKFLIVLGALFSMGATAFADGSVLECHTQDRSKIDIVIGGTANRPVTSFDVTITTPDGKVYVRGEQYDHLTYWWEENGGVSYWSGRHYPQRDHRIESKLVSGTDGSSTYTETLDGSRLITVAACKLIWGD
jgi:hypothetical protein